MPRNFEPFDSIAIDREFFDLNRSSSQDAACIIRCMNHYCASGESDPSPAIIKRIPSDIYRH
ncbi:hypothetical protein BH11ARM2_BH11ARM2_24610 [soil metagenome]